MRYSRLILLAPLFLMACGTTERTVVVNPPPDSTVVVDHDGDAHVVNHDDDRDRN
jgi:hypothetical protein